MNKKLKRKCGLIFFGYLCSMNELNWSENIIVADADHIDSVAFDLIVNFERMLGRRIPQADMARWTECIALDGGLRPGEQQIQVVLIHRKQSQQMENFTPGRYDELNGKAFNGQLGEFAFTIVSTEDIANKEDLLLDTLQLVASQKEVKNVMVVPADEHYNSIRRTLSKMDEEQKRVTLFTMEPKAAGHFRQEILGYSLMAALGIRGEELQ